MIFDIEDFDNYYNNLSKLNTNENNVYDSIIYLVKNPNIDIISFKSQINIIPKNLELINKDNFDHYFIEIELDRYCDIITNFKCNHDIIVSLNIHNKLIDIDKYTKIIPIAAMYSVFKLRFTFKGDINNILLTYDSYLAQNEIRKILATSKIKADNIYYSNGVINIV